MTLINYFQQLIKICFLDKKSISNVSNNNKYTNYALIFFGLGILFSTIQGAIVSDYDFTMFLYDILVFGLVFNVLGFAIVHNLARLFGTKTLFWDFFRPNGIWLIFSSLLFLSLLPKIGDFISSLVLLWLLIVSFVIIKEVYKLSTSRTVAVLTLSIIFGLILFVLLVVILLFAGVDLFGFGFQNI
jgi:hypothetical protein